MGEVAIGFEEFPELAPGELVRGVVGFLHGAGQPAEWKHGTGDKPSAWALALAAGNACLSLKSPGEDWNNPEDEHADGDFEAVYVHQLVSAWRRANVDRVGPRPPTRYVCFSNGTAPGSRVAFLLDDLAAGLVMICSAGRIPHGSEKELPVGFGYGGLDPKVKPRDMESRMLRWEQLTRARLFRSDEGRDNRRRPAPLGLPGRYLPLRGHEVHEKYLAELFAFVGISGP